MLHSIDLIRRDWSRNYKYRGGIPALARCMWGTAQIFWGRQENRKHNFEFESITFSVLPNLTALWAAFMESALQHWDARMLIGDSSGGFQPIYDSDRQAVYPLLNYPHGEKLDLFMTRLARADYVLVSDDDVFWLRSRPLEWAIQQFESDSNLAVVSFMPRKTASSVLAGKIDQPMGSFCLLINRKIWQKENLSFQIVDPPADKDVDWFYDTADYANLQLIQRGYPVLIAPSTVQQDLVAFEGMSSWMLRILGSQGEIEPVLKDILLRQKKAYTTIRVAEGLADTLKRKFNHPKPDFVPPAFLQRAKNICESMLSPQDQDKINRQVQHKLDRIRENLPVSRLKPNGNQ